MKPDSHDHPDQSVSSPMSSGTLPQKDPLHRWRLILLIVLIAAIIVGGIVAFLLIKSSSESNMSVANEKTVTGPLKVGTQPFIYPCAVATRAGFATAFGLSTSVQDYGSMQETSTLLPSQIPAAHPPTADLLKLIPHLADSSVSALCSLSGVKSGTKSHADIEVTFFEYPNLSAAQTAYSNTLANSKIGATIQPVTLTELADSNFLEPPDPSRGNQVATLVFLHGNATVELDYEPRDGEQLPMATAEMTAFAKNIGANINNAKIATTPTDLTGVSTFVGKPFVDVCRQADLLKIAQTLGSIQYRPDHVIDQSIYGAGQSAGSVSDCEVDFNTAQNQKQNAQALNPDEYFSGKATFRASTYIDAHTARTALQNQESTDQKGVTFVQLSGIGDAAYMTTQTYNGAGGTIVTTTYRIAHNNHVISIVFAQPSNDFTTTQIKQVYQQIDAVTTK